MRRMRLLSPREALKDLLRLCISACLSLPVKAFAEYTIKLNHNHFEDNSSWTMTISLWSLRPSTTQRVHQCSVLQQHSLCSLKYGSLAADCLHLSAYRSFSFLNPTRSALARDRSTQSTREISAAIAETWHSSLTIIKTLLSPVCWKPCHPNPGTSNEVNWIKSHLAPHTIHFRRHSSSVRTWSSHQNHPNTQSDRSQYGSQEVLAALDPTSSDTINSWGTLRSTVSSLGLIPNLRLPSEVKMLTLPWP